MAKFSTTKARSVLADLGITRGQHDAWTGGATVSDFPKMNPRWTMQQWTDLVRQNAEHIKASAWQE